MAKKKNPVIVLSEEDRDIIESAIRDLRNKQREDSIKEAKLALKNGNLDRAREELDVVAAIDSDDLYLHDLAIDWKEPEATE